MMDTAAPAGPSLDEVLDDAITAAATVTITTKTGRIATGIIHAHPVDPEVVLVKGPAPSTPAAIHRDDVEACFPEW